MVLDPVRSAAISVPIQGVATLSFVIQQNPFMVNTDIVKDMSILETNCTPSHKSMHAV